MNKSESITELAKALSDFQGKVTAVKKDATNPFFKSHYATLDAIWDTIRKPLSDNGLAVAQTISEYSDPAELETILMHSSGEWISGSMKLKPAKDDPQSMGSALSYARRYSLSAILGIVADEDDDANAASQTKLSKPSQTKPIVSKEEVKVAKEKVDTAFVAEKATEAQVRKIFADGHKMGYSDDNLLALMLTKFKKESTKELTKKEASEMIEAVTHGEGLS